MHNTIKIETDVIGIDLVEVQFLSQMCDVVVDSLLSISWKWVWVGASFAKKRSKYTYILRTNS